MTGHILNIGCNEIVETRISVIVPLYKGNKYITKIFEMMYKNLNNISKDKLIVVELILVNDFPQEELVVPDFVDDRCFVKIIENKKNSGIHFSRVEGLRNSYGEYILFLDQDDEISPKYINEQLKSLGGNDAIICNGKIQGRLIYRTVDEINRVLDIWDYKHGVNNIASPGQVLIKRKAIPQEWLDNILVYNGADDYFLWMLMLYNNSKMKVQDKVLYCHMYTGYNTSSDNNEMNRSVMEVAEFLYNRNVLNTEEYKWIYKQRSIVVSEKKKSDIIGEYPKVEKYKQLLEIWMVLRDRKVSFSYFFEHQNIKKIAIFGAGMFGRHLYYELQKSSISVVCFIDSKNISDINEIKTIKPGQKIEDIDAIIITPVLEYKEIAESLEKFYDCYMISLESVLMNADCELI